MNKTTYTLLLLCVVIHAGFSVAEIFLWSRPEVHQRVTYPNPQAAGRIAYDLHTSAIAAPIVANAGIYNAFLSAGLLWGLLARSRPEPIRQFFLWCVVIAGLFGAYTLWSLTPLILQTALAGATLIAIALSKPPLTVNRANK